MTASKADLWTTWLDNTLFEDIRDTSRPDPVPFLTAVDGELATTNALDRYRYGKNDGEYLYLLYLADEPINTASDITPYTSVNPGILGLESTSTTKNR